MATLKELMGNLTRGDGKRFFNLTERFTFEPIFKANNYWYGLKLNVDSYCANHEESSAWDIDIEPKPKKKVKMYRPVRKIGNPGQYSISDTYHEFKSWFQTQYTDIIGWQEIEIEVDE